MMKSPILVIAILFGVATRLAFSSSPFAPRLYGLTQDEPARSVSGSDTSCEAASELCPACDNQTVYGAFGSAYEVFCDRTMVTTSEKPIPHETTLQMCLEACVDEDSCESVNVFPDNSCVLSTGHQSGLVRKLGHANIRIARIGSPSFMSNEGKRRKLTESANVFAVFPTTPENSPSLTALSNCDLLSSAELCPACNGSAVVDTLGTKYNLRCDAQLSSHGSYAVQQWLTPDGCLAQCDNFPGCEGATFYAPGNCELAKGGDVVEREHAGFTAFLPLTSSSYPAHSSRPSSHVTYTTPYLTSASIMQSCNGSRSSSYRTTSPSSHKPGTMSVKSLGSKSRNASSGQLSHPCTLSWTASRLSYNPGGPIVNLTSTSRTTMLPPKSSWVPSTTNAGAH